MFIPVCQKYCTMKTSRRNLLAGLGVSSAALGLTTFVDGGQAETVHVDLSGNVPSEKPLVTDETLSIDSAKTYPNYYKSLVSSHEELRWDYFADDSALSLFMDDLEETDWDSQLVVIFGAVLPRTKDFQPTGETKIKDGILTVPLALDDRPSASSELVIMNYVERVDLTDTPDSLAISVEY